MSDPRAMTKSELDAHDVMPIVYGRKEQMQICLTMPRSLCITSAGDREAHEIYILGDFKLACGSTLRGAKLAYKTWGSLNADKSNAIVYPTWYSGRFQPALGSTRGNITIAACRTALCWHAGRHWENDWLIGPGMALDPAQYFIIVPNMFGNGLSSSPSNTPPPFDRARFPAVRLLPDVSDCK